MVTVPRRNKERGKIMTEKLYYIDAYIKEFDAEVISSEYDGKYYLTVLDKTAFFPEEGGQSADKGFIGGVRVLDAREMDGIVYHITESELKRGSYHCVLDFDQRFEKMQCHSAEHILCGIIHRLYGYENVGFHLGEDLVTFDVGGELTASEIGEVERLANEIIYENREISTVFPSHEELKKLEYRSKLELYENVRLVVIDGVDTCACCAPHVSYTGEIGVIKIVDFMRHRGGMRLFLQAGRRAFADYTSRYEITRAVGALTSTPSLEVLSSVEKLHADNAALSARLSELGLELARQRSSEIEKTDGNAVYLYGKGASMDEMREIANCAVERVGGVLAVLTEADGGYRHIIASRSVDLRTVIKDINASLSGKGGGRPEMVSGSFGSDIDTIKAYFN